MKYTFSYLFALLQLVVFSAKAQNPTVGITTFKNDAAGAYNIIHDDFGDFGVIGINNYVDTMTFNRNIKITFGAITSACESNPGMYAKAKSMIDDHKHEIINHSHTHSCAIGSAACGGTGANYEWAVAGKEKFNIEVDQSTQSILTNTGKQPRFFIYPYDQFNTNSNTYLESKGYIGSRTGAYNAAAANNFAPSATGFFQTALVVDAADNGSGLVVAQNLNYWVDQAIANKQWVNRELHNVGTTGWGSVDVPIYRNHLNYVKQKMDAGQLWVGTISEILTYQIQKRNYTPTSTFNAGTKTITVNWNTPTFNVAQYLQNLFYKSPITLKVDVSNAAHAGNYTISQNGISVTDYKKVGTNLLINVYPHSGPVQIQISDCATLCLLTQPASTTIVEGTQLQLVAQASGGTLSYQWYKNSVALNGQNTSTLTIANAVLTDVGNYHVVVSNGTNTLTSASAVVNVTPNPCLRLCISNQPQNTSVNVGTSASFSVITQGVQPITYQWYKNNVLMNGETSSTLTIPVTVAGDATTYKVEATNSTGSVTSTNAVLALYNQTPFGGSPINIPGTIQAENFDNGGQNIAYFDDTPTNLLGAAYRNNEVDLGTCTDGGSGYNIGYVSNGEWLEYTVNVTATGNYNFVFRTASVTDGQGNGIIKLELDGQVLVASQTIPFTGTWTTYTNSTATNIPLTIGVHVLRVTAVKGNFDLNYVQVTNGTLTNPTVTYNSVTKVYGEAPFAMTAGSTSPGAMTYSITAGNSFASIDASTGQVTILGAGSVTVQVSQAASGTYAVATKTATLTINKASLTATATDQSKVYGAANPTLAITYTGFVNGETASVIDVAPTVTTTATTTSNVGAYPLTLTGGSDNNYTITLVNGSLTVTKASLTATATDQSRIYGTVNPSLAITYLGFVNGETTSVIDAAPTATTTATTTSNVGTYPITLTGGSDNNYSIALVNGTLTVTKAALIATATNQSRTYGAVNPTLAITYTGFVNGETASVIDVAPTVTTTATTTSNVGTYPITLTGGSDNNYTIPLVNGTLTVTKATLTATASNQSRVYGVANPTLVITYTGFVNGETALVIDAAPTVSTTATTTSNVGTYPITLTGGSDNNYTIALVIGTLTVTKANLTATATNQSRVFGAANPTLAITYAGFVNGETASVIDAAPTATTTATTTSNVGTFPITLTGGSDNNYTISLVNGTLTVTKATLIATATNQSRVYGVTNPTLAITYTGFVNGETSSVIDVAPAASTTATAVSNVGTYPITLTGGSDGNYTIVLVNGTLTITQATPTLTYTGPTSGAEDASFTLIATTNSTATPTYSIANVSGMATLSGSNLTLNTAGTVTLTVTIAATTNYIGRSITQTITINNRPNASVNPGFGTSGVVGEIIPLEITTNSTGAITYTVTNETGSASLNGNQLTLTSVGTVTVTITIATDGTFATTTFTQTINISNVTSVVSSMDSGIKVYPSVTESLANLEIKNVNLGIGTISITNMNGVEITSLMYQGESEIILDASSWPVGLYVIKLQTASGDRVTKLIKQ